MEKKLAAKKQHTLYTSQFNRVVQNHNQIIGTKNKKLEKNSNSRGN